jgi:hypothetical protein
MLFPVKAKSEESLCTSELVEGGGIYPLSVTTFLNVA